MRKSSTAALLKAAGRADLPTVRRLLREGADPNASYRNYRPLHALIQEKAHSVGTAASRGRLATLDLLLKHGADPEQLGAWPPARATIIAAFAGSSALLARLLEAGAVRNVFVDAARGDAGAVARRLAKDPGLSRARDEGGLTALQCAAGSRLGESDPKIARGLSLSAERLLSAGADPNARTRSWGQEVDPAYFACTRRDRRMMALLLDGGADATRALPSAIWTGDYDLAGMILERGAAIDRAIDGGRPLLLNLIRWGRVEAAIWLLERGADANVRGPEGWTALHQAVSRGSARMIDALLDAGARTGLESGDGRTPMTLARETGRSRIAAMLRHA